MDSNGRGVLWAIRRWGQWSEWHSTARQILAARLLRAGRNCFTADNFGSRFSVRACRKELLASAQRSKRRFGPLTPNISPVYVHRPKRSAADSIIQARPGPDSRPLALMLRIGI